MPTYVYRCPNCDYTRERSHRINETPTVRCGRCDCRCTRIVSKPTGFILKGSGWYKDGYR